jgi:hypothetical protein
MPFVECGDAFVPSNEATLEEWQRHKNPDKSVNQILKLAVKRVSHFWIENCVVRYTLDECPPLGVKRTLIWICGHVCEWQQSGRENALGVIFL